MRRWRQLVCAAAVAVLAAGSARATTDPSMTSNNYSVTESEVGGIGDFGEQSNNYSLVPSTDDGGATLGESAVGNSSSNNYSSGAGFNTTAQPGLMLVINTGSANLGVLSTSAAQFATATFDVRDYTSYGYVVQVVGTAPTYNGHSLSDMNTSMCGNAWGCASVAGSEQFGLNLVRNTVAAQGANPAELPSSSFAYGVAGDGTTGVFGSTRPYTVSDAYRFVSGETVASAPQSSGDTQYTMTFIANQSNTTPSGTYVGNVAIVATGSY